MPTKLSRRTLFRLKPADLARLWVWSRREQDGAQDEPAVAFRPPGALASEEAFMATCERCHRCVQACPASAIQIAGPVTGEAEGTPLLSPLTQPCLWCPTMDCIEACPSGALSFGADRFVPPVGRAVIDPDRCLTGQGILCDTCAVRCPPHVGAIRMRGRYPELDAGKCVGCGLCAAFCEAEPGAIAIEPVRRTAP